MTWKSRHEIFQPGSPPPAEWASYDGKNPCGEDFSNDVVTLGSFSKFSDFNQTSVDNPLIAQNHTYVRYEVRVNKEEFESIVDNNWYLYDKLPNSGQPGRFKIGSTSIKAAWRVLLESETPIRKRYYVARAQVFDYARQKCIPQDVALVGLHIVTKAKERPQWIWSTFEHIDNVPSEPPVSIGPFSFNNPKLPQKLIPQMPLPPISCENKPITANPMQVIRYQEINPDVMNMNRAYWKEKEIKDTVWKNYMLVAAQWPLLPNGPMNDASEGPGNDGFPFRPRGALSNTTMETYLQQFEHNGMSCMECHNRANKLGRDFVMFVGRDAYLSSHGLAPGDHFSSKLAGGSCNAGNVLSDDPMLKSLLDFFRDAARER